MNFLLYFAGSTQSHLICSAHVIQDNGRDKPGKGTGFLVQLPRRTYRCLATYFQLEGSCWPRRKWSNTTALLRFFFVAGFEITSINAVSEHATN